MLLATYCSSTNFGNSVYISHNYNWQNEKALSASVCTVILSRVAPGLTATCSEKGDSMWHWSDVGEMSRVMDGDTSDWLTGPARRKRTFHGG